VHVCCWPDPKILAVESLTARATSARVGDRPVGSGLGRPFGKGAVAVAVVLHLSRRRTLNGVESGRRESCCDHGSSDVEEDAWRWCKTM
jgi:hypothetical protein